MPNHIHLVCTPLPIVDRIDNPAYKNANQVANPVYPLCTILRSLKRHTARQANLILGRQGAFWQEENYDHVARDLDELNRIIQYVLYNPVKAQRVENWEDWRWAYYKMV